MQINEDILNLSTKLFFSAVSLREREVRDESELYTE